MKKSKTPPDIKKFLIPILRKASLRWPARTECLRLARKDRNQYECAICKNQFPRTLIHIDHINPVVAITGFTSWDDYVARLFVKIEELQAVCTTCHTAKSMLENNLRAVKKKRLAKEDK